MTWQVISERSREILGAWPHEELIASMREKVEAGTHLMAHRHTGDKVQLVVMPRKHPGKRWDYWSAPNMPDITSERLSESAERRSRAKAKA